MTAKVYYISHILGIIIIWDIEGLTKKFHKPCLLVEIDQNRAETEQNRTREKRMFYEMKFSGRRFNKTCTIANLWSCLHSCMIIISDVIVLKTP